jgi:hypothetical protein
MIGKRNPEVGANVTSGDKYDICKVRDTERCLTSGATSPGQLAVL